MYKYSSNSYILNYNPTTNVFGQTYKVTTSQNLYGIAPLGLNLYLTFYDSSNTIFHKRFRMDVATDTDTMAPIIPDSESMVLALPSEYVYQAHPTAVPVAVMTGIVDTGTPAGSIANLAKTSVISFESTDS